MYRKLDSASAHVAVETRAATKKHIFRTRSTFSFPDDGASKSSIFRWDQAPLRQWVQGAGVERHLTRVHAPRRGCSMLKRMARWRPDHLSAV